ncbi:MAG: CHAT domain-containing protein [Chloroflexota bacterium]
MSEAYYTYRIRIAGRERVQVDKLNPKKQSLGQPSGTLGYQGDLKAEIDALVAQSHAGELQQSATVRALGEALFNALFDPVLRQDFVGVYNQVVHGEKKLLRIELDIDEQQLPDVAALPWEFMRLPADANLGAMWLGTATNLIFSRRRSHWFGAAPIQLGPGEKLRIGVAVAAPPDLGPLMHEQEIEALEQAIAARSEQFDLLPVLLDANPVTLDTLLARKPHVLHFIGHGRLHQTDDGAEGQLALVRDVIGNANWVDADFFSELLNTHRPAIVLLQACEGAQMSSAQAFVDVAARVVRQNIPVVVAMQYAVTNITAVRFAARFYEEVAKGSPVDQAAQNGRRTIGLHTQYGRRDFATPVLFMRVEDGHLFVHPETKPEWREIKLAHPAEQTAVSLTQNARTVSQIIANQFNLEEIDEICREMGFDPENLRGSTKNSRAQSLFEKSQRRSLLDQLVNAIAKRQRNLIGELKANLYLFIQNASPTQINEAALTEICEELQLDCQQLQLDANGLVGYTANNYIRAARTKALQDHMVENGRYPELVAAVKKRLPHTDLSIFEL